VRVRGFAVLQDLKTRFPGLVENVMVRYDGSFDELPEFILQTRRTTITLFCRRFLRSIFPNLQFSAAQVGRKSTLVPDRRVSGCLRK
jgi:hypothetical protein